MLKKLKNFCRLTRRSEGFTLVELVVVIAIVAILSGIAVPAYGAYVEKSQKAGDLQLLAAVNKAFAAAAFEHCEGVENVRDATIEKGSVDAPAMFSRTRTAANSSSDAFIVVGMSNVVGPHGKLSTDELAAFNESFLKYYEGNWESEFKATATLNFENGVFTIFSLEDQKKLVDNYKNSNFGGKEEALLDSLNNISDLFTGWLGSSGGSESLKAYFLDGDYDELMETYGLTKDSSNEEVANAVIMFTASKVSGMTGEEIFANPDAVAGKVGTIPAAALLYGAVTGYANSEYASDTFKQSYQTPPSGITDVKNLFEGMLKDGDGFTNYSEDTSDKGAVGDMNAFLSAMNVVNNYEGTFDLSDPDLFENEDTKALLDKILGTSK